ncbi:tenascin-N [Acrasis kona]|uniref:Tenascin-N n=1 Tax=Acrasis kona TaxID=1008807 RepID=A0AAW2ZGS3_9EUKA
MFMAKNSASGMPWGTVPGISSNAFFIWGGDAYALTNWCKTFIKVQLPSTYVAGLISTSGCKNKPKQVTCDNGINRNIPGVCSGVGNCTTNGCICPKGRSGINCEDACDYSDTCCGNGNGINFTYLSDLVTDFENNFAFNAIGRDIMTSDYNLFWRNVTKGFEMGPDYYPKGIGLHIGNNAGPAEVRFDLSRLPYWKNILYMKGVYGVTNETSSSCIWNPSYAGTTSNITINFDGSSVYKNTYSIGCMQSSGSRCYNTFRVDVQLNRYINIINAVSAVSCAHFVMADAALATCNCKPGYYGRFCNNFTCNSVSYTNASVCSGNGICADYNTCICNQGYTGVNCEIYNGYNCSGFNSSYACSGNGYCTSNGTCICPLNYTGPNWYHQSI